MLCASAALAAFGRATSISSRPDCVIDGSVVPIWSMRWRMMSIAFAIDAESTGVLGPGRAWKISSTPPWRSRPRRVFFAFTTPGMPAVTTSDTSTNAMTKTRTKLLRARSLMANRTGSARRREHEQEAAVVVVGREEVGGGPGRQIGFGAQHGG